MRNDIAGVVLAGGKSTRISMDKALLPLNGLPLIQHVSTVMQKVFGNVIVVSDHGKEYEFLHLPIVPDIEQECGPLGGIHSAFSNTTEERLFVVACDTPFLSEGLLRYICDFPTQADIKVPSMNGRLHPLCALYSRSAYPLIEQCLAFKILRLQHLLLRARTTTIPIAAHLPFFRENLLVNVNDLKQYEALHHH